MPSFLSKVFGNPRKKQDKDQPNASNRHSDPSLLEGKFERVSPNVSPTADNFANVPLGNGKEKEKDGKKKEKGGKVKDGFGLLRTKSSVPASPADSSPTTSKNQDYFLSLNLPSAPKDDSNRALGVVFEGDDAPTTLGDAALGRRRLNPTETLALVRSCSQEIMAHGLETLGIMHPHWYSASPETQRRLITLFLQSLASKSPSTTLSTDTSSFEYHISSTRSMHDVAAVLRWGIRHLQLEGSSFGHDSRWYSTFFEAERNASYPPRAFSEQLVPLLPRPHLDLLNAALAIFSSLAAHAEANGSGGSKLSMLLGLWLLTSQRSESGDDWKSFYDRWERNGRILEHLFLAHIRDEAASTPMPKRLTELVSQYPYTSSPTLDSGLLPRTRFSTRRYDALFIHVDTEVRSNAAKPPKSFTQLLSAALTANFASDDSSDSKQVWEKLKQLVTSGETVDITLILSDDTLRLLSLLEPNAPTTPILNLAASETPQRKRSLSLNNGSKSGSNTPGHRKSISESHSHGAPVLPTISKLVPSSGDKANGSGNGIALDWSQFSSSGFIESSLMGAPLAETLMDKDVEVTKPPSPTLSGRKSPSRKSSEKRPGRGRKSLDALPPISIPGNTNVNVEKDKPETDENKLVSRATQISIVKLDEAFVDFWADALLDPISEGWPRFVICRLKSSLSETELSEGKKLEWLVIEQKFVKPAPSVPATIEATPTSATETASPSTAESGTPRPRPTSPKPSFRSFSSSAKKRFTFWSSDKDKDKDDEVEKPSKTKKKKGATASSPKVGEMGEILKEEDEVETVKKKGVSTPVEVKGSEVKEPEKTSATEDQASNEKKEAGSGAATLATGVIAAGAAAGVTAGIIAGDEDRVDGTAETENKVEEKAEEVNVNGEKVEDIEEKETAEEKIEEKAEEGQDKVEQTAEDKAEEKAEEVKVEEKVEDDHQVTEPEVLAQVNGDVLETEGAAKLSPEVDEVPAVAATEEPFQTEHEAPKVEEQVAVQPGTTEAKEVDLDVEVQEGLPVAQTTSESQVDDDKELPVSGVAAVAVGVIAAGAAEEALSDVAEPKTALETPLSESTVTPPVNSTTSTEEAVVEHPEDQLADDPEVTEAIPPVEAVETEQSDTRAAQEVETETEDVQSTSKAEKAQELEEPASTTEPMIPEPLAEEQSTRVVLDTADTTRDDTVENQHVDQTVGHSEKAEEAEQVQEVRDAGETVPTSTEHISEPIAQTSTPPIAEEQAVEARTTSDPSSDKLKVTNQEDAESHEEVASVHQQTPHSDIVTESDTVGATDESADSAAPSTVTISEPVPEAVPSATEHPEVAVTSDSQTPEQQTFISSGEVTDLVDEVVADDRADANVVEEVEEEQKAVETVPAEPVDQPHLPVTTDTAEIPGNESVVEPEQSDPVHESITNIVEDGEEADKVLATDTTATEPPLERAEIKGEEEGGDVPTEISVLQEDANDISQESDNAPEAHNTLDSVVPDEVQEEADPKVDSGAFVKSEDGQAIEEATTEQPSQEVDVIPTHEVSDEQTAPPTLTEQTSNDSSDSKEGDFSLPPVPIVDSEPLPQRISTQPPPIDLFEEQAEPRDGIESPNTSDNTSHLPPAVASVVAAGDTPGPEVALSSSEPIAQENGSDNADKDKENSPLETTIPLTHTQDSAEKETA
ncbi:hypothetical protein VNI00_006988 [Paramarasmius palmivorus]|uniref:Meiotically up-regulated protein Msb1/Mug8 domain-containing protein n=1 Tax=Paramarasmius palmivorus TaxID=297713 RepID=A0AAW0D5E6_9AGAR